ncbi:hypothetical protein [Paenibacillus hexagrammi]|uniref:Uncharacterized protein n=1 Tax=Paenibacillus hexagrammi TaxID=2908839 RepID=A0ABY3SRP3_9BACL|nr:hypothetical protein [Paenibacillus sp. YPD9-1]UJF36542.1 hypothetical protein L0M14_30610 [Paenibacillus sp. YPD9-1]
MPVYTVQSLPRQYEILELVSAAKVNNDNPLNVIDALALAGGSLDTCDAVIGITVSPISAGGSYVHAYGTAIRYI